SFKKGSNKVPVNIAISGGNYFPLQESATLEVLVGTFVTPTPHKLYMSNSPERVKGPQRLFEGLLAPREPVRFMMHHLNDSSERLVYTVKARNTGKRPVAVYFQGAHNGPHPYETVVGYHAGIDFLKAERNSIGMGLTVPGGSQVVLLRMTSKSKDVIRAIHNI